METLVLWLALALSVALLAALVATVAVVLLLSLPFKLPYVGSKSREIDDLVAILDVRPGERILDVGSGDGRIVAALARAGAEAHGIEINPLLAWWSRHRLRRQGLGGRTAIRRADFWKEDLSEYDAITIFGIRDVMAPLQEKVVREARPGARVALERCRFPELAHAKERGRVLLYVMEERR